MDVIFSPSLVSTLPLLLCVHIAFVRTDICLISPITIVLVFKMKCERCNFKYSHFFHVRGLHVSVNLMLNIFFHSDIFIILISLALKTKCCIKKHIINRTDIKCRFILAGSSWWNKAFVQMEGSCYNQKLCMGFFCYWPASSGMSLWSGREIILGFYIFYCDLLLLFFLNLCKFFCWAFQGIIPAFPI